MRGTRAVSVLGVATLVVAGAIAVVNAAPAGATPRRAVAGDFDGDGIRDLALGAPGHDRVRVRYSRSGHVAFLTGHAASTIPTAFGQSLATGDFNGDGYADLAVGAPDYLPPHQTGGFEDNPETEGAVFEFFGSRTGLRPRPLRLTGPYDGDDPFDLGVALAAADVNGDGRSDLAAVLYGDDSVSVEVFRGSSTGLTRTHEQDLDAGFDPDSIAFGDVNRDHRPDLVVGTTSDLTNTHDYGYGAVTVYPGRAGGTLRPSGQRVQGQQVGVHGLGSAVAVGDVNGDGYGDVVAGASDGAGNVVLLTGRRTGISAARHQRFGEGRVTAHPHGHDAFGAALAVARVTGDRYADVVVGAPGAAVGGHANAGAVYLVRGRASGLTAAHAQRITQATRRVPGNPRTNAYFGSTVYAAQLVGSRNADAVIGAPDGSAGASGGGFVIRLRGTATGLTARRAALVGDHRADDRLGQSIA